MGGRKKKCVKTYLYSLSYFITPLSPKILTTPRIIIDIRMSSFPKKETSQVGTIIIISCLHRVKGHQREKELGGQGKRSGFPTVTR